jgi:phage baseplate assembly protein W
MRLTHMAAITFKDFESKRKNFKASNARLYTDLALDMSINDNTKDLNPAFDEKAIVNSLYNILTTRPGQNLLQPEFGLNLSKDLFTTVSEYRGEILGQEILVGIERFEPRVRVLNINVVVSIERQEYNITMVVYIPALNRQISFNPVFTEGGEIYIGNN